MDPNPRLIDRISAYVRKNGSHVLVEALVNFILPFVIYNYAEAPLGEVRALLASSAPPILWSLVEFARHRRLDAVSVLVVSGIALSLLAMIGGGGARFLQLREKLVTGVIGLVFLGSALIGKPLIYELARASMRRKSAAEAEQFEALQVNAGFRRTMTMMTLVWGVGLLADVAVSVVLVFVLSIRQYLIVNPIIGYGTMGALSLWTFLYGQRAKRRGEARRAAARMTTARLNGLYSPQFAFDDRQQFPVGTLAPGMDPSGRELTIMDARALQAAEGGSEAEFFSRHAFVLLPHVSAVGEWDDESALYQPEIDRVIRERLLPGKAVEIQQGPKVLRRGRGTTTPEYADGVHSDGGLDLDDYVHNIAAFSNEQAAQWWRTLYERPDVSGLIWIDFWRTTNMGGPLEHMPLALCDPTSVEADDVVPVGMTGIAPDNRQSRHLSLRFNARQRWYYYPGMTTDELLAFKLAEFWKTPTPFRNCFHSAFPHQDTPEGAEMRQSCEHRVGVLVLAD